MAVTLSKSPPRIAFSRNPIVIELTSDDYLATAGAYAKYIIKFNGTVNNNALLKLTWGEADITFTAKAAPDSSGLQFPTGNGGAAHVQNVLTWLKKNFYLSRNFNFSYTLYSGVPSIVLNAKATGALYNISAWAAGNIAVVQDNAGVNTANKPNFNHYLEVWKVGATHEKLYGRALSLDALANGRTTKNIADIIRPYLDYDRPDLTQVWTKCSKSIFNYYLRFSQYYGETPDFKAVTDSSQYTACLGGYSNMALTRISADDHLEKHLLPVQNLYQFQRWFESFPIDQFEVRTNQPQLLYFINCRDIAETLDVSVKIHYSDLSSSTKVRPGGLLQPLEKVCVGCGYQQLGLQNENKDGQSITGYEVSLVERITGQPRSVKKKFTILRDYEAYTRYILYSDSCGNFKTLHSYGRSTPKVDVSFSEVNRYGSVNTPITGDVTRYDIRMSESDELNTGYITSDRPLSDLKELVAAEQAYRVFGTTLVPILITNKTLQPEADGLTLNAMKIEYKLAFDETNYTGSTGALPTPSLSWPTNAINDL